MESYPAPAPQKMTRIMEETGPGDWREYQGELDVSELKKNANLIVFVPSDINNNDKQFKLRFQEEFWPVLDADINGSFHCEYGTSGLRAWPAASWACFKVKEVKSATDYNWRQPTIHVEWDGQTGRQLVHVFELSPLQEHNFILKLPTADERKCNPFIWHAAFARIILGQYDGAFWLLRDLVRHHEKERSKTENQRTQATRANNFPLLHDIARHLFHYQETIEVAEHTLQTMAAEQMRWRREDADEVHKNIGTWMKTRQRILFEEKSAHSLKTRSKSLNDRHQNEINLAFNLVSQSFGRDARSDSNMMKTVAVVSMVYLPGTFVSGMFGTNFFSFQADPGNTWLTADEFWIYWAVTVPLTLATVAVWAVWHWRDTYAVWWGKIYPGKTNNSKTSAGPIGLGAGEKPVTVSPLRRIATALRLSEIQRHETV